MVLNIDQSLQQAVAAHKEGRVQDAERLYRAILQSQSKHPDANHNLGVLAVSVNQAEAALPLFKTALETNPRIEQFWLSYIDALIKEKQFDNAKQVLKQAKKQGVDEENLSSLEAQIVSASKKEIVDSASPPPQQLISLLEYYQNERHDDAEKLARSLSTQFPRHNLSWKVLAAIFKKKGKASMAVVAGEKAVEITPEDSEAHSNLGNTLQKLGRLEEAAASYTRVIVLKPEDSEAHSNLGNTLQKLGRLEEAAASYTKAIALKPDYAQAHSNLGITLQKLGRLEEAAASYTKAIALQPDYAGAYSNLGNTLKELGRLEEAAASYTKAIALQPDLAQAYSNLGVTLKELGRLEEAAASYTKAIALQPDYAGAYSNLGNTLQAMGRSEEAEKNCRQAITLEPDSHHAHNNLGVTLRELGRLEEAEENCRQAITLKPDFHEAHNNLGAILQDLGRSSEAIYAYAQALTLNPDCPLANTGLGIALKNVKFNSSARHLYPILINLLKTGNLVRPRDIAQSILSILKYDPLIETLLSEQGIIINSKSITSAIESLDKLPLLHHLMRVSPLPHLQFEGLFVVIRKFLLKNLDKMEVSPELINFLSTLSLHCFTNEYVYIESDEETHLIDELQANIRQTIAQSGQPEAIKVLCLASYRALHQYDWCQKLESLDNLEEVKVRLIEEPMAESIIKKSIPTLAVISDDISLKVKQQYEENPYPRWVGLQLHSRAESIAKVCDQVHIKLHSKNIRDISSPEILVAGCGTGQHPIETASRYSDCQVVAVDLSLASLAYAQRKTRELGLNNLNYLQADILELHRLDREFDIIESAGVLHHMDEPMVGWKVLTDLLKPGGLMKIGLYSESARQDIVKVRKEIASLKLGGSEPEIRTFRQSIVESHNEHHHRLSTSGDFFSLSAMRDLIFHVQEHRFTLPQIKNCLDELGLKFCGFDNENIISKFRESHDYGSDIYDLTLWHKFEKSNPRTFAGMYQFWCQKL